MSSGFTEVDDVTDVDAEIRKKGIRLFVGWAPVMNLEKRMSMS